VEEEAQAGEKNPSDILGKNMGTKAKAGHTITAKKVDDSKADDEMAKVVKFGSHK